MKKNSACITLVLLFSLSCASCKGGKEVNPTRETVEVKKKYLDEDCKEKGTVEAFSYQTKDYVYNTGKTERKTCNVYLPFGYDKDKQYNILYLLHGTDPQSVNHINTWFDTIKAKVRLDNRISYKIIEPRIVIAPTFYSYGLYGDDTITNIKQVSPVKQKSNANFVYELRYDIVPRVEGNYSTFASSTDEKGLQDSRDHRARAGLSNGCRLTYTAGRRNSFDYFSYFGCYSSSVDSKELLHSLHQDKFKGYPLHYRFNADGIFDFAYNGHHKRVEELKKNGSDLFNQDNTEYVRIKRGYHSARSWRVGLFDSLLRFFR